MARQYSDFARYYDLIMGNRSKTIRLVKDLIHQTNPNAKDILELACGTGQILEPLSKKYNVYGLDLSKEMLSISKKKIPEAKLFHTDMTKFDLERKFDVILCLFDSINHITSFNGWEEVFSRVVKHLNPNGVFIFDINTISKLDSLTKNQPWVNKFGKNMVIMSVSSIGKDLTNWNTKIFENISGNKYNLIEEDIKEISFPIKKIKLTLEKTFKKIRIIDKDQKTASDKASRVYFICKV